MNQPYKRDKYEYENKTSHFHYLKYNYNYTDSNKILTHRKYHTKLNNINSQKFKKIEINKKYEISKYPYELKQTHYHYIKNKYNYTILNPTQIASHNIKHTNNPL